MIATDSLNTDDLRTKILDAARHLMVTDGYSSLSMRKIAKSIGYSATSIYLHFSSKDELFYALIDEGMDKLYSQLESAATACKENAAQKLDAVCRSFVDFGLSNREYYEVMFVLHPDTGSRYPADKYRKARQNIDVISDTLKLGRDEGSFFVSDVYLMANTIWAMLHGVIALLIAQRIDRGLDQQSLIRNTLHNIESGLTSTRRFVSLDSEND